MNSEEIIDMAIQAGASPDENKIWLMYAEEIETFAKLVVAKATAVEREACAKIVEDSPSYDWHKFACEAAAAIRARGEQA
jgi:hypothetical protein